MSSALTDSPDVRIDGPADIRIRGTAGQWVKLAGRRPDIEAAELVDTHLAGASADVRVIVIGPALGHVVEAVFARCPDARVIALEPDAAIAQQMLARRDWQPWIARQRFALLTGPEYVGASRMWTLLDGTGPAPLVIVNPVVEREWSGRVTAAREVARRMAFDAVANADARARFAGRYLLQTLENLTVMRRSRDVGQLFGSCAGMPAVVVGAGPSLDLTIAALAEVRDRVIVIAVDTALKPLLAHGLTPDVVIAVDPAELNARHLTNLPALPSTWLVAEPSIHPSCFEAFEGRTLLFRVAAHHPWPWLAGAGLDCAVLRTWGSVLTSGFDLAAQLGCDPIAFIGADLAYTGGQPYCRGTAFEDDWAGLMGPDRDIRVAWDTILRDKPIVMHPDLHGTPAATAPHLVAFRDWIVDRAREIPARVVNASGAGLLHGGRIEQASLASLGLSRQVAWPSVARTAGTDAGLSAALASIRTAIAEERPDAQADAWRRVLGDTAAVKITLALDRAAASAERHQPDAAPAVAALRARQPLWTPERRIISEIIRAGGACPDRLRLDPDPSAALAWLGLALDALVTSESVDAFWPALAEAECRLPEAPPARAIALPWMQSVSVDLNEPARLAPGPSDRAAIGGDTAAAITHWIATAARVSTDGPDTGVLPDPFLRLTAALVPAMTASTGAAPDLACRLRLTHGATAFAGEAAVAHGPLTAALIGAVAPVPVDRHREPRPGDLYDDARPGTTLVLRSAIAAAGLAGEAVLSRLHAPVDGMFDREWMIGARTRWASCRVLTGPAFEACCYATSLPHGHALTVSTSSWTSYDVAPDGTSTPRPPWPDRITAEIPWGDDGGAIAWLGGFETTVFVRRSAHAAIETHAFPGYAFMAHVTADGRVIWPTINAGVWHWEAGRGCELLVRTPPVVSARPQGDGLAFDPIVMMPGPAFPRIRLDYTWTLMPGATAVERRPVGPEGQCRAAAVADGWTALPYSHSDLVRVKAPGGRAFNLHVPAPLAVVWLGPTLLVTTVAGTVLQMTDLRAICSEDDSDG